MRVQVNVSDEIVKKVDLYAEQLGVSRSALCSMFIGQGVMSYDKAMDAMSGMKNIIKATLEESVGEIVTK